MMPRDGKIISTRKSSVSGGKSNVRAENEAERDGNQMNPGLGEGSRTEREQKENRNYM